MDFQMQCKSVTGLPTSEKTTAPSLIIIKYYGSASFKYGYRSLTRT